MRVDYTWITLLNNRQYLHNYVLIVFDGHLFVTC